jgi:hypothetical protein
MRSFCSLRVKTKAAEVTRSGEFQRLLLIGHQALAKLQLILAVSRSGYSWLSSSIVGVVTSFIGRLFASACCLSSAFVLVGGKLSVSGVLQSSGFVQRQAAGFFCRIESVRMHFAPDRKNSRPRAPEALCSASGGVLAFVALKAWPNQPVNLTRNGMRQSAAEVSFAHSSSPAACRMPLRSGYRQR